MNELQYLPRNIRHYRLLAGLKQTKASKMIGISSLWWSWIETGRRPPSLKTLQKMCEVLNINLTQVFEKRELV